MAQLPRMVLIPWQVETLKSVIGRQQDRIADIIERLVTASAATQHRGTCRRQILWGELSEGLARARERAEDDGMRSAVASLCVCWLAYCSAPSSNTAPLAFGMTPKQTEAALGVPLVRYPGRRRSNIMIAAGLAPIPGYYPVDTGLALQFRRGRLTGWKQDWRLRRPPPFI